MTQPFWRSWTALRLLQGTAIEAAVIDVHFRAEPPVFKPDEGVVVAPIAVDLPGVQHVLDVASQPAHLRKITTESYRRHDFGSRTSMK